MSITGLAIKRPIIFLVLFIVLGGLGFISYKKLKYELLPDLATPYVTILTSYPGASPKEVENSVTKKIEESLASVTKVKKMSATSSENLSAITLAFIADANADQAVQDVQRAISGVLTEMPAGVKSPYVDKFNINDLPVLRLGITANITSTALYELLKDKIKPRLAQLKSAGRISILGGEQKEVKIWIDPDKMASYQISNAELVETIRKNNNDFPLGNIKDTDAELSIRMAGKISDPAQVAALPIRVFPDGSAIRVKDVARVENAAKSIEVVNRLDRAPSIGLFINKQSGANAVDVSEKVSAELKVLEEEYKNIQLKFDIAQDSSEFTLNAAKAVYTDFFIAILLVALVMLVFLHSLRNAAIVLIAIPTSLVTAFIMMYLMDYSLNLMTLLAMSLVIGILVDDSIVVLENIYRHMEMGKGKVQAALDGRNEISFTALSITLVDVVVFLPMALVPGLVGSLVKQFSLVIVVSTLTSLFVCFTLTPMLASRFAKLEHLSSASFFGKTGLFFEQRINALIRWYTEALKVSLQHKMATILITVGLLIASLSLVFTGIVGAEFTPATDKGELSLLIDMQPGTKLFTTDEAVKAIEEKLKAVPEITKVFTNVGYQSDGFGENTSGNVAAINISLKPAKQRTKSLNDLSREIRALAMEVGGVKARVSPIGLFGANDAPIQILLSGNERDSVLVAAGQLMGIMRATAGVVSPRMSSEQGKPEIEIEIDPEKAALLGLDIGIVGANMRSAINGYDELKFRGTTEDTPVRIQLQEDQNNHTSSLSKYSFTNHQGALVYLNQFAKVVLKSSATILQRRAKQASLVLLSQVTGRPVGDVGEDIKTAVAKLKFPPGVQISYEGDLEMQDDAFTQLGLALLASFSLVYLIMVALYNNWVYPFVVLFSIPVAAVGALLALALTAKSLNVFSILGLIMMMGLVAKNAILLVDRTNEARAEGKSLTDALLDAGSTRLRPILMTTLAMVIGMLPLALAKGAAAEMNSGLAWVLIGGLSSSMFLTLFVVPVIYDLITRFLEKSVAGKAEKSKGVAALSGMAKVTGVFLLMVFAGQSAVAQTQKLSLQEALNKGLSENIQIKQAELEELKAKHFRAESKGNLYPNISASGEYYRNVKSPVMFFPTVGFDSKGSLLLDDKNLMPVNAAAKNSYSLTGTLSMPVFNREIYKEIEASKWNEQLAKVNTLLSKTQLADEIRRAYYHVLATEAGKALVAQSIKRAEFNLRNSRNLVKQGMAVPADTLSAFVNLESMKINELKSDNEIRQSKNFLKNLIQLPLQTEILLSDELKVGIAPLTLTDTAAITATENRPEIIRNRIHIAAAMNQIELEKSKYLPSLNFISQYQLQTQSDNFRFVDYRWPNSMFVGLRLSVPIFSGFKTSNRIKQARATAKIAELENIKLNQDLSMELQNAKNNLNTAWLEWEHQGKIVPSAERNLQLIISRWQKGVVKYHEVADAELTLIQVKNGQLQAAYGYLMAEIAYLKASNQLL
ncbi:hydrophobe/amphiphile efflux-1 (HAE1) family protein [Pedobacter steynii]|uniref:Hydrophobe/amphiphile efflux-1 (HAE1) family protein n=1 Tax=Pedobacter steynii TaxID=430522 RepID=A0A1H0CQQ0_9SPHI|nr:efflux RND transporter permease subunit [Pedobacter steynii]NQX41638.1 efflux RND transporter permease subunit [Pedobacter steynii]SDN60232.1 hydrophobe/amphiphile efflux-1 (HAE1) family protein [Pedobacter steynii]